MRARARGRPPRSSAPSAGSAAGDTRMLKKKAHACVMAITDGKRERRETLGVEFTTDAPHLLVSSEFKDGQQLGGRFCGNRQMQKCACAIFEHDWSTSA